MFVENASLKSPIALLGASDLDVEGILQQDVSFSVTFGLDGSRRKDLANTRNTISVWVSN
jgi:hypothetical protein